MTHPNINQIERWIESERDHDPPEDGFDEAWFLGAETILKIFRKWDYGISENYINGIQAAIMEGDRDETDFD